MRETILLDALEEIKKLDWQNWQAHEIAINALNDFASAPESGGEEARLVYNATNAIIEKYPNHYVFTDENNEAVILIPQSNGTENEKWVHFILNAINRPESGGEWKEYNLADIKAAHYAGWYNGLVNAYKHEFSWAEYFKDLVPSVQSSDVKPVASHTSTSSNSIEQEIFKALADLVNLKNYKEAYGKTSEYEEQQPKVWEAARQAIFKKLNSEQEDKR